jgi:regulator of protease activity HflC (stomatin/prohibitin superfamily)
MKAPFIDQVDRIKVAKDTLQTPDTTFFTKDTQSIAMALGITYDVPDSAVYNLLYQTGNAGNHDIDNNITKIIIDRVRSILSKYSISDVAGPEREQVMAAVKAAVSDETGQIFGIHVVDVQIPVFRPSEAYMRGIEQAVQIRNAQLQAQLNRDKARTEAETLQINTTAQANAQIEQARGQKEASIHAAEAEAAKIRLNGDAVAAAQLAQAQAAARSIQLRGDAEASAIAAKIQASGGTDSYIRQLQAQAMLNWKGDGALVPQMVVGGATAPVMPFMQIPIPAAK